MIENVVQRHMAKTANVKIREIRKIIQDAKKSGAGPATRKKTFDGLSDDHKKIGWGPFKRLWAGGAK